MSLRPRNHKSDIQAIQNAAAVQAASKQTFGERAAIIEAGAAPPAGDQLRFDDLTPVEQAAASLGVQPFSYKPIKALNDAYYSNLQKANVLDRTLERRIEAFKHVATADALTNKA